nr:protein ALP1-like [Tanacetum cinerariifolium]
MNQNQIGRTVFDIDEESDAFYFQKAIEYHEWLLQQGLNRTPIFRDRKDAERHLRADYFDDHSNPLPQHFHFFTSRLDCTGQMSISALMKCTAAIRQFAYGSTADAFDEYLQMNLKEVSQLMREHSYQDMIFVLSVKSASLADNEIRVFEAEDGSAKVNLGSRGKGSWLSQLSSGTWIHQPWYLLREQVV